MRPFLSVVDLARNIRIQFRGTVASLALLIALAGWALPAAAQGQTPPAAQPAAQPSAPPAVPPSEVPAAAPAEAPAPAGIAGAAQETAAKVAERFREAVFGTTLTVGIARTDPTLQIHPGSDSAIILESYEETGAFGGTLTLASPAADILTVDLGHGYRISPFVLNLTGNLGTFKAHQTLQTLSNGAVAAGTVRGSYLFGAGQLNQWLLWESDWLPGGLHSWAGWGLGLRRYSGGLDYSVSGNDYAGTIQNDGNQLLFAQTFGLELRLRSFVVSAYGVRLSRNGLSGGRSFLSVQGERLADYTDTFEIRTYTLGYVFSL